jgi:CHAT domain-containing protein/Tfp pilus assembly protein PilF
MKNAYLAIAFMLALSGFPATATAQIQPELTIISQNVTREAAIATNDRARALYDRGTAESLREAISVWEEALLLWRALGDREWEALTLNNIGFVYNSLGDRFSAIARFEEVLEISQTTGDRRNEALTLLNLGFTYSAMGDKLEALHFYEQSLAIWQELDDVSAQATLLNNIGNIHRFLGNRDQAMQYFQASIPLLEDLGDRDRLALTLLNVGVVHSDRGEKQEAFDRYNQALAIARETENQSALATSLNNLGALYDDLGDKEQALDYYQQSLPILQQMGDRNREALTLVNIGKIHTNLAQLNAATQLFEQAATVLESVGDRYGQAIALNNLGLVYYNQNDYPRSLQFLNQAVVQLQQTGNRLGEARTQHNLATIYQAQNDRERALAVYNQALAGHREVGDRYYEARSLGGIAQIQSDLGDLEAAVVNIEAAIAIIESLRVNVASPELRTSFFASNQDFYEFYIDLLMELHQQQPDSGYDAKALHVSERARARSLLELLAEANADIRTGVDSQLLTQERSLQQQLDQIEQQRVAVFSRNYTPAEAAQLEQLRADTLEEYQQVQDKIRAASPNYAALTQPQPLTLPQIQQQILDDDTLLLQYALGKKRSFLWVISKDSIDSYILPPRAEIESAAQQFYQLLNNPLYKLGDTRGLVAIRPNTPQNTAPNLSHILLEPIADRIANKRLLIVSDGALQYIPFAALPLPGTDNQPLIQSHEVVNLPSVSTLAILRSQPQPTASKQIAILADPVFSVSDRRVQAQTNAERSQEVVARAAQTADVGLQRLPGTREEANAILALVEAGDRRAAFDFQANREFLDNADINRYRILHFATHGILNSTYPELSGIILSLVDSQGNPQNGFLRLHDVYNLDLNADLVVLSACQTGLGKEIKGEGLVGLTRGFMYAGASRTLVSLWNVDDRATAEMMSRFYHLLLKENLPAIAALRQAQLEMQTETQWTNPYYWAAFTLQGEWEE